MTLAVAPVDSITFVPLKSTPYPMPAVPSFTPVTVTVFALMPALLANEMPAPPPVLLLVPESVTTPFVVIVLPRDMPLLFELAAALPI